MEFVPAHFFSPFFSRCQRRFMKIQNITTTAGSDCRRRLVKQRKVWEEQQTALCLFPLAL